MMCNDMDVEKDQGVFMRGKCVPFKKEKRGEDDNECDGKVEGGKNKFTDYDKVFDDLTCKRGKEAEKKFTKKDPCNALKKEECMKKKGMCLYKGSTCAFNAKAKKKTDDKDKPEDMQLYAVYEWKYLTVDGEETKEEFCFNSKPKQITTHKHYDALLLEATANMDADLCEGIGAKWSPEETKVSRKGKERVFKAKCSKPKKLNKCGSLDRERCAQFADAGCKMNKKGKCSKKFSLKDD